MPAPTELHDLVARFREQHEDYRRGAYNETQLRRDFLDPLFALLGWDVDNRAGYAESFREVVHEDAVKVGGMTKAPDYSFRIGGRRLFFLEAKKPAIHIKEEIPPAYQLRRYAWSAGLQLSILSDFEEFAVYDGSIKPNPKDKPAKARVFYCTYEEYADKWDEIAALFSKEAVLKGGIDRFARKLPGRRGTATVDAEFLAQIEHWRDLLARNIALRNDLDVHALNHAVQATIDRIVFLRICEDRGIENEGRLLALTNGSGIYARLTQLFRDADDRYNSGLFHFRNEKNRAGEPDAYTLELAIDDKPLKDIIRGLYYPESPYEFAVLPADILGQVYERFLGKVIRLTGGGQAKVEEKPEVKKAGGVYYTPTYIVDYIVRQTVGRLLEGKNPKQAERLRICDPACGSGSFLIGAYQHLLDWHLKWYAENDPQKHASGKSPKLRQSHDGWRLTVAERKRILINNIYGVDIDAQAVEVTKLSLLLKVLEGETGETLGLAQMKLFHERALPNLDANILCGNSLIGTDFYDGRLDLDEEERRRINAFDWEAGFPEVFKAGGFDAVIGNPPYLNIDDVWGKGDTRLQAVKARFSEVYNDKTDILFYFLTRAIQLSHGYVSFIVSRAFLEAYKADKLRAWLLRNSAIQEIVDFQNHHVFKGVGITTAIVNFHKKQKSGRFKVYQLKKNIAGNELAEALNSKQDFTQLVVSQTSLSEKPWAFVSGAVGILNKKIDASGSSLDQVLLIGQGMQTGCNSVFGKRTIDEIRTWKLPTTYYYLRASNSDIQRYRIKERGEYLLYLEHANHFKDLPRGVQTHLLANQSALKERAAFKRGNCSWWQYTWPLHKEWYSRPKILCPYLAPNNRFALDSARRYIGLTDTTVLVDNGQPESMLYLLGLLNSKLLTFRFKSIGKLKSGGILEYFWNSLSRLPIRRINFKKETDRARHDKMVKLVESMLKLHEQLAAAKSAHDKTLVQRQIDATDRQIDALVYELYGLTQEEIRIVEGG